MYISWLKLKLKQIDQLKKTQKNFKAAYCAPWWWQFRLRHIASIMSKTFDMGDKDSLLKHARDMITFHIKLGYLQNIVNLYLYMIWINDPWD